VAQNMSSCSERLPSFLFSTALRIWSRVTITPGSGTRNPTLAVLDRPRKSKSNTPSKASRISSILVSKSTKRLRKSICSDERNGSSEFRVKVVNLPSGINTCLKCSRLPVRRNGFAYYLKPISSRARCGNQECAITLKGNRDFLPRLDSVQHTFRRCFLSTVRYPINNILCRLFCPIRQKRL
jgi:hypothetical protein